jgi:hypothetical protein
VLVLNFEPNEKHRRRKLGILKDAPAIGGIGGKVAAYLICGEARLGVVLMGEAVGVFTSATLRS